MASANHTNTQLEIATAYNTAAAISFHKAGVYGANFGLDQDNWFSTQGWSAGGGYTSMRVGNLTANGVVNATGGLQWNGQSLDNRYVQQGSAGAYRQFNVWQNSHYSGTDGAEYATIYYDANDSNYFIDPNGTSNISYVTDRTKSRLGLTGLYNTPRSNYTGDTRYWTGVMGWGTNDFNTIYSNWGSGFFDTWSSPGNAPGGSSHYVGLQAFHFNHGDGTNAYGFQMAMAGEANNRFFWRSGWPGPRPWVEMIHSGNIASYAANQNVNYAASAGSANSIAWSNIS
ncbi:MAG: hypothetical protein AAB579_00420, partial [Patescibacteria group bacterium]